MTHKSFSDNASAVLAVQAFNMHAGNHPENLTFLDCASCPEGEENTILEFANGKIVAINVDGTIQDEPVWDLTVVPMFEHL